MKETEEPTVAFNLRLPASVSEKLKIECRRQGMTKQGYIQRLIETKLNKAAK